MRSPDADVIIVGAGPAGSLAAYELASKGAQVLILEKAEFPRYKTCGGGLTHKVLAEIPFDISSIVETTISSIRFSHHFKDVFTRNSQFPLMYCTMRSELDAFLLKKAIAAGAEIQTNQQVVGVKEISGEIIVSAKGSEFRSKLLIGAEGASGIVARSVDLRKHIMPGLAWEAEIRTDPDLLSIFSETVFLDWGTFPGGYGWAFPKKDHFSIGVGGPASLSGMMMPYYQKFLTYFLNSLEPKTVVGGKTMSEVPFYETISLKSWPIPVRTRKSKFHNGSILITGDSAGLTDPLTGEGIYYAIRSGKLAAEVCHEFLAGNAHSLDDYSEKVNEELMKELLEANKIKHLFNAFPLKIHFYVKESDRVWRAFGKILRGERWYIDVRNGFGRFKYLWNLVCTFFKWIEILNKKWLTIYIKKDPPG
jgi:geranylgeranyl reductase family protein